MAAQAPANLVTGWDRGRRGAMFKYTRLVPPGGGGGRLGTRPGREASWLGADSHIIIGPGAGQRGHRTMTPGRSDLGPTGRPVTRAGQVRAGPESRRDGPCVMVASSQAGGHSSDWDRSLPVPPSRRVAAGTRSFESPGPPGRAESEHASGALEVSGLSGGASCFYRPWQIIVMTRTVTPPAYSG